MRAAKSKEQRTMSCVAIYGPQPPTPEIHISGAEGIYTKGEIRQAVQEYVDRAITHPRGRPDSIVITIEQLNKRPKFIKALPLMTAKCGSSSWAKGIIGKLLTESGVTMTAISSAMTILQNRETIRGAGLVIASSGCRVEPDLQRGVRASRFGISRAAEVSLSTELDKLDLNTKTVREALVLASKVASCSDVVAEVCISDDPDYTTGYVASASLGYVRIPHIKKKRDRRGGRVFFLRKDADIRHVMDYLEKIPVIVKSIPSCSGEKTIDEIIDRHHQ